MDGFGFQIYRGLYIHVPEGTDVNLVRAAQESLFFDEERDIEISDGCSYGPYSSQEVGILFGMAARGPVAPEQARLPGTMAIHFGSVALDYGDDALAQRIEQATDGQLTLTKISYQDARALSSTPDRFPRVLSEGENSELFQALRGPDTREALVKSASRLEKMECYVLAPAAPRPL